MSITTEELKMEYKLQELYTNPASSASFGGINRLQSESKVKSKLKLKRFLESQNTYTLHKFARKKFLRRKVCGPCINYTWQMDLIQLDRLSRYNKGFKFVLTIIDTLSRYAYAVCLKSKKGSDVLDALKNIITENNKPSSVISDGGMEFKCSPVQAFFKKHNIVFFESLSEFGAATVERFNQTLMSRIHKYFTENNTKRYCDVLDQIVHSYNNSVHRITKFKPSEVNEFNQSEVWMNSHSDVIGRRESRHAFRVNDTVRVIQAKPHFFKGYTKRFGDDLFIICEVVEGDPIVYKLKDSNNRLLPSFYYEQELSRVSQNK